MKSHSAKAKGRRLQQFVVDSLKERSNGFLDGDDISSRSSGATGEDVLMSPAARFMYPFSFECKNIAKFVGYKFMEQCYQNAGEHIPVVVVKANNEEPLVLLQFEDFMGIITDTYND